MTEYFDVVDKNDRVIGKATRKECHSNPELIHRGIHVLVFSQGGELLLQKRVMEKDLYPGKWDSSASGHVKSKGNYKETAKRELKEELGVELPLKPIFTFLHRGEQESEMIEVFVAESDGPFKPNSKEIDDVKFFTLKEIKGLLREKPDMFSNNFIAVMEEYFKRFGGI